MTAASGSAPVASVTNARSPVIILSYAYSGAGAVQDRLAAGTDLACTAATGIVPLCEAAADTWHRVEGQPGPVMSQLALSTLRTLVTAQVTVILAAAGQARWCELAAAAPSAVSRFCQIFPEASFVSVHRGCPDVIRAGIEGSPWGLQGQGLMPFLLSYPGNSVAALAAHWVSSTEQLLAFEAASGQAVHRIRYEDVIADPAGTLAPLRAALRLETTDRGEPPLSEFPEPQPAAPDLVVPVEMIPRPLQERIRRLHGELGYPPLEG